MFRARADRRIATALFIDVVDSTRIAATLGDRRWRELLAAYRRIVRQHLRRNGGREVDTAGDGFFATFSSPAPALRAAAGIVADVQMHGLDVRCGLHTGELERIDGQPGGLAAHIAARVMAQAGGAEILTTATVRDLVVGGAATFEPIGEAELKGVPGRWILHRLGAVDGHPIPNVLGLEEAASRRESYVQVRSRARQLALGGGGILVAGVIFAVIQMTRPDAKGPQVGSPSPSPTAPIALMKLDWASLRFVATVRDPSLPRQGGAVQVADGNLWFSTTDTLTRRDLETGEVLVSIDLPPGVSKIEPGFGSIWVLHGTDESPNFLPSLVDRYDASGSRIGRIVPEMRLLDFAVGDEAVYLLAPRSKILEVDPGSNQIVDRDRAITETETEDIGYIDGSVWLRQPDGDLSVEFDTTTDKVISDIKVPSLGKADPETGLVWMTEQSKHTITHLDLVTRELGFSIGLNGVPRGFTFGLGAVWLAAEEYVYRIDSSTQSETEIPMPEGVIATGVAIHEETHTIWVSTCAVGCEGG